MQTSGFQENWGLIQDLPVNYIFSSSTTWDRSTMHPKFDLTRVRTHDLQVMTVHFMSLWRPALTIRPSVTPAWWWFSWKTRNHWNATLLPKLANLQLTFSVPASCSSLCDLWPLYLYHSMVALFLAFENCMLKVIIAFNSLFREYSSVSIHFTVINNILWDLPLISTPSNVLFRLLYVWIFLFTGSITSSFS